jgi:hypothetical protein
VVQQQDAVVNTSVKKKGSKASPLNALGCEEEVFQPEGSCGREGQRIRSRRTEKYKIASSDAMGVYALAVRCQREARICCREPMDYAAVHHTIAAFKGLAHTKALSQPYDHMPMWMGM